MGHPWLFQSLSDHGKFSDTLVRKSLASLVDMLSPKQPCSSWACFCTRPPGGCRHLRFSTLSLPFPLACSPAPIRGAWCPHTQRNPLTRLPGNPCRGRGARHLAAGLRKRGATVHGTAFCKGVHLVHSLALPIALPPVPTSGPWLSERPAVFPLSMCSQPSSEIFPVGAFIRSRS